MKKSASILFLLLLLSLTASAGGGFARAWKRFNNWLEQGQLSGIDTNYVQVPRLNRQVYFGGYAYWQNYQMNMPFNVEDASMIVRGINDKDHYHLDAHTWQAEIDFGIDWKGLAIEIPIPIQNNYLSSLGIAKNGSVWGARLRYKHLQDMDGNCNIGNQLINRDDNEIFIFFAEGYYVLKHRRFSLAAGLYADMVQKRSAGSPLLYANYYRSHYKVSKLFPANFDSFRTQQVSVGAGYAYNLSFLQGRLVFHASLVPMFSIYNQLKHRADFNQSEDKDLEKWNDLYHAADHGNAVFHVNAFARFAANYSFDRYIVSLLANYRNFAYANNLKLKIRNQEADIQLNFCTRF